MLFVKALVCTIVVVCKVSGAREKAMSVIENEEYAGDKFPAQYLAAEERRPTPGDLDTYIRGLMSTVTYFAAAPNNTEANKAIGLFYTRAILKRTINDDIHKIQKNHYDLLKDIIRKCEWVLSHYLYANSRYYDKNGQDVEYRISQLMSNEDGDTFSYFLDEFKENTLQKWIRSKGSIHEYLEELDSATLPKEKYVEIIEDSHTVYHIRINESDVCLGRVIYNRQPSPADSEFRPCVRDRHCQRHIHASPSVAYGLSHRMLNVLMYRNLRRCYWVSPRDDAFHLDILCAFMYREAVYIARRGYFARDLFLEHVALCSMMGYTEFFRRHWFHKAVSWITEDGCIQEEPNHERNRSLIYIRATDNVTDHKKYRKTLKELLLDECHNHPMAVLVPFLSSAIRHAVHFL